MIAFRCCRMNSPRFNHTTPSNDHLHLRVFFGELCLKEALHILLTTHNPPLHSSTYFQLLQTCIAKNAHSGGRLIHSFIIDRGFNFGIRKSSEKLEEEIFKGKAGERRLKAMESWLANRKCVWPTIDLILGAGPRFGNTLHFCIPDYVMSKNVVEELDSIGGLL
ncbi:hypothetical protein SUGI_0263080 [Cryptomeria japonica]|nr:hypothetical protein SUGI_0263080 [Cryptomeria japonica]